MTQNNAAPFKAVLEATHIDIAINKKTIIAGDTRGQDYRYHRSQRLRQKYNAEGDCPHLAVRQGQHQLPGEGYS